MSYRSDDQSNMSKNFDSINHDLLSNLIHIHGEEFRGYQLETIFNELVKDLIDVEGDEVGEKFTNKIIKNLISIVFLNIDQLRNFSNKYKIN